MADRHADLLRRVAEYYGEKLTEHGPTPRGVDWNSAASQETRFEQVTSVIDRMAPYSLIDYGCGYGALCDYLRARGDDVDYVGFDIARGMLDETARSRDADPRVTIVTEDRDLDVADYTVASGIFNVRLDTPDEEWLEYVVETIGRLASLSRRGFAFNMLTIYSDPEYMRDDLYYGDPRFFFDHCKRHHSREVALLHDYGLYEFTIRVRLEDE